jgi:hypothetical protein
MPPMPVYRYPRDDSAAPATNSGPNVGLIAGLVTCGAVILFLSLVLVVPMLRRRHQRSAPPPATVEEFLGKDSTFERSNPQDIAAILDHLSYLPQNPDGTTKSPTPKRRSFLLGRRLSSQRPSSIIGPPMSNRYSGQQRPISTYRNSDYRDSGQWSYYEKDYQHDAQHSVPADIPPPLDEYANEPHHRNSFYVPASAPAHTTSFNATRPLNIRSRNMQQPHRQAPTRDVTSPGSDYSQSDSEDEYSRAHGSPYILRRPHTGMGPGKENRGSTVGESIKSRFNRDSSRDSFSLAAAPRSRRNRPPPPSKSSNANSPAPPTARTPLDPLPEMPNSSIAVGFALPDSPGDVVVVTPTDHDDQRRPHRQAESPESFRQVPLTPRNVALPRTPRTPGSPLKEVFTVEPPRTPLREVLAPRTPRHMGRQDVSSPF